MQEGRFDLTNDEFHAKIAKSFKTIYRDKKYTDLTLATADGKQIRAHKVILSSFSPFFEKILETNPHEHPLIFLKGIKYRDLESLMQFAYLGECEVGEGHLQEFLEAGKDLQIHGLAEFSMNQDKSEKKTPVRVPLNKKRKVVEQEGEEEEEVEEDGADLIVKVDDYVDQFDEMPLTMVQQMMEGADTSPDHYTINSESPSLKFSCEKCEFQTSQKLRLTRHIYSTHEVVVYDCEECDFSTKRKGHLKNHRESKHQGIKHQCDDCESEFVTRQSLTIHKKKHHSITQ